MAEHFVQAGWLAGRLGDPDLLVVDCRFALTDTGRGAAAYREGHIPGARYAHLDDDLSDQSRPGGRHPLPLAGRLAGVLARWGWRPGIQVVAYDDASGAIAGRLWWLLRDIGHRRVALLDGGLPAWLEAGGALESGPEPPSPDPAPPTLETGQMPRIDADRLERELPAGAVVLVDARAEARFAGREEPLDPVAGHVPGAVNRPFSASLDAAGGLRSLDQQRPEWQSLAAAAPLVHMCGSGVTACFNLLVAEASGCGTGTLYPGSWSEWCSDPDRPVGRLE